MKTSTTKRATRRLAASLAIITALATTGAWAAKVTYNWTGGSGGTEAEPLDLYNAENWANNALPSRFYNYELSVDSPTVLTNSAPINTQIADWFSPYSGDFTFLGPMTVGVFCWETSSANATIVKKGDWTVLYDFDIAHADNSYVAITNVSGNMTKTANNSNLRIGAGNNSTGIVENLSGDWTVPRYIYLSYGTGSRGDFTLDGGSLNVSSDLRVGYGSGATGLLTVNGGEVAISGDLYVGDSGTGTLTINGGTVDVGNAGEKWTKLGNVAGSTGTINLNGGKLKLWHVLRGNGTASLVFNGGTLVANGAARQGLINSNLPVTVNAGGGTIDNGGLAVTVYAAISGAGGLTFTGSGTTTLNGAVSYSGKTCVTPDTTLTVANATAKSNILSHGLELVGAPTVGKPYTVFVCNDALDAETDLANVTCGVASEFSKSVGADGKSIVVTVTALKSGYWTGGAGDNNLSTSGNWSDNIVPTSGIAEICCPVATTLTVGDKFEPSTITIPKESAVVTLGAGALHVNTLTNASKLAIGAGASLTVANDLVTTAGVFLHSNEGTVTVGGKARGYVISGNNAIYQYESVSATTQPIRAKGLAFDCYSGTLYMLLSSKSEKEGLWVLGSDGMTFPNSRNINSTRFYTEKGAHVTLSSSADWTLENCIKANVDSNLYSDGTDTSIALDTSDYDDPTVGHTITLNGRLHASGAGANFTVKGCGTVVVDTTGDLSVDANNTRFDANTTLYVTDAATLQVNAGKKILGSGTVSLAAGTTLALDSSALGAIGDTEFTPCIIPGLALPTTGTATIRIGGARLRSGDHVIATVASGTTANVDLDLTGTALGGRKGTLRVEDGKLILNIQPDGLMVIFR